MIPVLYRGSVKDLLGPVPVRGEQAVIFEYTDAYSVFDWGRMPDQLARKGEALAVLAADWFERFSRPESWREFSKSPEALALRKANRFGSQFNELGELLQAEGLRTHYLGVTTATTAGSPVLVSALGEMPTPVRHLVVKQVSAVRPAVVNILGRAVPDYLPTRQAPFPRLVPLEVVFRFSCPEGSSLLERAADDQGYMASIGFGEIKPSSGARFDFPVLELFTKLEASDRLVSLGEALAISGLSGAKLDELLLKTAWIAGMVRWLCAKAGVELADGKVEWGVGADGEVFLVDAIGPDELRILKDGVQLSKEFLRAHYRNSDWYRAVGEAKDQARVRGVEEWKKGVALGPPTLPPELKEIGSQLYLALTNELTGKRWFPSAWSLERVISELKRIG